MDLSPIDGSKVSKIRSFCLRRSVGWCSVSLFPGHEVCALFRCIERQLHGADGFGEMSHDKTRMTVLRRWGLAPHHCLLFASICAGGLFMPTPARGDCGDYIIMGPR